MGKSKKNIGKKEKQQGGKEDVKENGGDKEDPAKDETKEKEGGIHLST